MVSKMNSGVKISPPLCLYGHIIIINVYLRFIRIHVMKKKIKVL